MSNKSNINKYKIFRKEFPVFIYEDYSWAIVDNILEMKFLFNLSDKYYFKPSIKIPLKSFLSVEILKADYLENLIFNIGMVELISYWKAACPEKVIIKNVFLNKDQIEWWKKLYFNGLGEFFYLNGIDENINDFMSLHSDGDKELLSFNCNLDKDFIIPVGGGKDSAVSLELLSDFKDTSSPMVVNPGEAIINTIHNASYNENNVIVIRRYLDPLLLELNSKGFLNGHTPFSALLAFISALASVLSNKKNIALSNESSANEATIPGTKINHQYSKSYEFEQDFRYYLNNYISPDINYFSLLRPLNELQIAKLFSNISAQHSGFRSCNIGSKTNSWCGECPKCLFTYIILSPYLEQEQLERIFNKNLLDDIKLKNIFNELTGLDPNKPFECIGTIDEVNTAICLTIENERQERIPELLKYYKSLSIYSKYSVNDASLLEKHFENKNFVPPYLQDKLKQALCLEI
jgi:hypothetical protein